ncbi:MAG: hypothetical protein AAF961_10085 [Planctomycetota bacterium]
MAIFRRIGFRRVGQQTDRFSDFEAAALLTGEDRADDRSGD